MVKKWVVENDLPRNDFLDLEQIRENAVNKKCAICRIRNIYLIKKLIFLKIFQIKYLKIYIIFFFLQKQPSSLSIFFFKYVLISCLYSAITVLNFYFLVYGCFRVISL